MRKSSIPVLVLAVLFIALPLFAQTSNEGRPYDVRIVFIGLMTFDMGDNYQRSDPITVIVPNLTKGAPLLDVPKHVSYLLADRAALPASHPMNQYYNFQETPHQSDNFIYLPFNGFHISVDEENDVAALNGRLDVDNKECKKCPDNKDENGRICWLSSMEKVKQSLQERDEVHFARQAPPLTRDEVTGRMVLRYGTLRSYVVGFPGDSDRNEAPIFDFKRSNGTTIFSQALAQETHWTFHARGIPFVLNLESINPGGPNERVAFMPTFPDQDMQHPGELTIIIGNTTPNEVGPLDNPATPTPDKHYAVYYRFIKNTDGAGPLPAPEIADDKFVTCKNNINDPILLTLLAAQVKRGTAAASTKLKRVNWTTIKKDGKAKDAKAKGAPADQQMDMTRDPAPGGLNCTGIRWR